jgi:hypothetical protein
MSDDLTVTITRHTAWDDNLAIPCEVTFDQYQVWVTSDSLKYRNPLGKLMVGYIGIQDGANFCPAQEFYGFGYKHRRLIVDTAKQQHGHASPDDPVDVPPHFEPGDGEEIDE